MTPSCARSGAARPSAACASPCNTRRKDQSSGEWVDKPNYFDVTVWGAQGENCAQYLAKGRPVAIDGRLEWREWEDQSGNKRQSVDIIADSVQFLGSREGGENGGRFTPQSDVPGRHRGLRAGAGGRRGLRTTTSRSDPDVESTQEKTWRSSAEARPVTASAVAAR